MDPSSHWELIAAGIALAAGLWSHIKAAVAWFRRLMIVTVWVDGNTARMLTTYLSSTFRRNAAEGVYGACELYVKPLGRIASVVTEEMYRSPATYYIGWRPLWFRRPDKPLVEHAYVHTCSFIRGTVDWDDLLYRASVAQTSVTAGSYKTDRHCIVYHFGKSLGDEIAPKSTPATSHTYGWANPSGERLIHWKPDDIGSPSRGRDAVAHLALSPQMHTVAQSVRDWYASREWHSDHGIPWRLGHAYVGAGGTGKTSFARALAQELDLPVHVFDLASMSNKDLREAWRQMMSSAPCMALIEDIDAVFHGRENQAKAGMGASSLTFDTLLNCIDGIETTDGIFLVVTTNHPELVDPALLHRKKRIDEIVTFVVIDYNLRLQIARRILDDEAAAIKMAVEIGDTTVADFTTRCCRAALDGRFARAGSGPFRE